MKGKRKKIIVVMYVFRQLLRAYIVIHFNFLRHKVCMQTRAWNFTARRGDRGWSKF